MIIEENKRLGKKYLLKFTFPIVILQISSAISQFAQKPYVKDGEVSAWKYMNL